MTRIVDPYRFYALAAVTDWNRIGREHAPQESRWMEDWLLRKLSTTTVLQLRWSINPQIHPALPAYDIGMPTGPFTVWARRPSDKDAKEIDFSTRVEPYGKLMVEWWSSPLVYVIIELNVTGAGATVTALNSPWSPWSLEAIESTQAVGSGVQTVVLSGTSVKLLQVASDSTVTITKIRGITAIDYANSDEWMPIEIVGLPVDQTLWSGIGHHADNQGLVSGLTTPVDAALDRLRRGSAPFGWQSIMVGANSAPAWSLPDFHMLVEEVQQDLLPRLHPVMQLRPVEQLRHTDTVPIHGPQGSRGTLSEPSSAKLSPLGLTFMAGASDPLLALTLGFGTAYDYKMLFDHGRDPVVDAVAMVGPALRLDFMVTAEWEKGFDGLSSRIEMAALAINPQPPIAPPNAANMLAEGTSHSRPASPDTAWTSSVRVSWDRLPRFKMFTTTSFALARANLVQPLLAATAIMRQRPSGGYSPIALSTSIRDIEGEGRHSGVDTSVELPMSPGPLAVRYGVALQDLWGQWSAWATVDHSDEQPNLDRPRILKCALDATAPAAGRICPATLTVDMAWDWEVRRPQNFELRCRLFAAPDRSSTPPPDTTLPSGMQYSMAVAPGGPLLITFTGDAANTPLPPNVQIKYFDIDGHMIAPGPQSPEDVRRYKFTVTGFSLDYDTVGHVGIAVWSRVQERASPHRHSGWLPPLVSGSSIDPGPNIAYASDPIPPPPEPPELVRRTSLADARGEHHARISWAASNGAVGYFVYHSTESAILAKQASPSTSAAGLNPTQTYTQRLAVLRTLLNGDTMRRVFTRINTQALTTTSTDVILPRGTKEIHLYTVIAVNAGNIESAWPTAAESNDRIVAIAAPGIACPAPPIIEIRRVGRGIGVPQFEVHVKLRSRPGAQVSRYELYRTRVEAAAMSVDTMGPPVAKLATSGGDWVLTMLDSPPATPNSIDSATGIDRPLGSWKKLWYRAVAWAHQDDDRALMPGRSEPSNAMSVVIPPDGPPDLSPLTVEWPGGPLQDVLLHFTSLAPTLPTALGPHKISVDARIIVGPSHATQPELYHEESTLDAVQTSSPAATANGLWRSSTSTTDAVPTSYSVLLRRGSVDDELVVMVRIIDPLGRQSERMEVIPAGPVDPAPDVLSLQMVAVGDRTNIGWTSTAPLEPRAGGGYRLRVTLIGAPKPPIGPRLPTRLSVGPSDVSVAELLRKPLFSLSSSERIETSTTEARPDFAEDLGGDIVFPTIRPRAMVIEMALADVPLTGHGPASPPSSPWQLERQNGIQGSTSYSLVVKGHLASVTVRITAPDGRFAEEIEGINGV